MAWGIGLVPVPLAAARALVAGVAGDVGQQRQLAGALDGAGDLVLVTPARARDAARADLPAVGHELAQEPDVLVVDLVDLVPAEGARLAASRPGTTLLVTPASRPAALLSHVSVPLEGGVMRRDRGHGRACARADLGTAV